jgi:hypothetical protein
MHGAEPADLQAVLTSRAIINEEHTARMKRLYEERANSVSEEYRQSSRPRGVRQTCWDEGRVMIDSDANLECEQCWGVAGAMRELHTPYVRPPWEPVNAWDKPMFAWDIFPVGVREKFRAFVQGDREDNPTCPRAKANMWTTDFYDRAWACVCDSIRRDWARRRPYNYGVRQAGHMEEPLVV